MVYMAVVYTVFTINYTMFVSYCTYYYLFDSFGVITELGDHYRYHNLCHWSNKKGFSTPSCFY